ncbi:MAG: YeeE/YedE family protein [Alphaproteobacteria bacterium]|nr:YeeE/YedE family protein [Alphaproteobacteria bacterium]
MNHPEHRLQRIGVALVSGILFGLGLTLSDMIDPARVLAFLDVAGGAWDPTLAFVMGGALAPMVLAWRLSARLERPRFSLDFPSARQEIDSRLLGGAALFGAGWGLVGFCPGPALAALFLGGTPTLIFLAALAVGMGVHGLLNSRVLASPA